MEQLFFNDKEILAQEMEKHAAPDSRLPEGINNWPSSILESLYAQAPYLSEYSIELDLSNLNKEAKTAYGYAIISSKIVEPKDRMEENVNKDVVVTRKKIRIPLIIKDGLLSPIDIFLAGGKPEFLTERRVRKALFRPNTFDIMSGDDIGADIGRSLANIRYSNMQNAWSSGPYKLSSALKRSLNLRQFDNWNRNLEADEHLKEAALNNKTVLIALDTLSSHAGTNKEASVDDVLDRTKSSAMQFWYEPTADTYMLKKASRQYYSPTIIPMGRRQAIEIVGEDLVKAADVGGPQTLNLEEHLPIEQEDIVSEVEDTGFYKLRKSDGGDIYGFVFVDVRNFDGTAQPYKIMTNGDSGAIQETMYGIPADGYNSPPEGELEGFGSFFGVMDGKIVSLPPCTITQKVMLEEGYTIKAEMFGLGEIVDILISEGVKKPVFTGEKYLVPDTFSWTSIGKIVPLAETVDETIKIASAEQEMTTVQVINSGGSYTFRGPAVEKLGSAVVGLGQHEAEFVSALLGHTPETFSKVASVGSTVPTGGVLKGCLPITLGEELKKYANAKSREQWEKLSSLGLYPVDLLKEATFMEDPTTVDAILSLNFINPENIAIFSSYKNILDDASKKLAELLLAVRLGIKEIPEGSIIHALKNLERVILGLSKLEQM